MYLTTKYIEQFGLSYLKASSTKKLNHFFFMVLKKIIIRIILEDK